MDNLEFGRKVAELRRDKGYSQEQLATLIGVKNKSISKYENGKATPRRSVCDKLSGVLGFDFDLMISDSLLPDEAEALVSAQREKLWEKAEAHMKEIYGEDPPLTITNRFILERNTMRHSDSVIFYDILSRVYRKAREKQARFEAAGAQCFTAWLLGATRINPVEPHRYCEKCHRVEFHPEVQSGWDLPIRICECGSRMTNEGQDIPPESYMLGETARYETIRCNTDEAFMKEAETVILSYGEQFYSMERWHEDAEDTFETDPESGLPVINPETGKKIPVRTLPMSALLFRPKKKAAVRKPGKVPDIQEVIYQKGSFGTPAITLLGGAYGPYYPQKPSVFQADAEDLIRHEILEKALLDWWAYLPGWLETRTEMKIPDIEPHIPGLTFGKFIRILCAVHCVYISEGPEELAEKTGFTDWTEMPVSHADLWKLINRCTQYPGYMNGAAGMILHRITTGKYLQSITPGDRKMFREMNLPEWFETYAQNIFALSSRGGCTDLGIHLLEDARLKLREEQKRIRRY